MITSSNKKNKELAFDEGRWEDEGGNTKTLPSAYIINTHWPSIEDEESDANEDDEDDLISYYRKR